MGLLAVQSSRPVWPGSLVSSASIAPWFTVLLTMGRGYPVSTWKVPSALFSRFPLLWLAPPSAALIGRGAFEVYPVSLHPRQSLSCHPALHSRSAGSSPLDAPTQLRTVQTTLLIHAPGAHRLAKRGKCPRPSHPLKSHATWAPAHRLSPSGRSNAFSPRHRRRAPCQLRARPALL